MLDIVFRPPAYPITAEVAADNATNFGLNPLELCYENPDYCHWTYWYSPGPTESESVVYKKPLQRSVIGLEDAIRGFLQERGLSFAERESLWAWAVRHRWPRPGFFRPEGAATDSVLPAPDGAEDWRDLVTRGGTGSSIASWSTD